MGFSFFKLQVAVKSEIPPTFSTSMAASFVGMTHMYLLALLALISNV